MACWRRLKLYMSSSVECHQQPNRPTGIAVNIHVAARGTKLTRASSARGSCVRVTVDTALGAITGTFVTRAVCTHRDTGAQAGPSLILGENHSRRRILLLRSHRLSTRSTVTNLVPDHHFGLDRECDNIQLIQKTWTDQIAATPDAPRH